MRWLVDGMNVIGAGAGGWWRDREGAMRELAAQLSRFAGTRDGAVTVVFDGREPREGIVATGVEVIFAPGGPDAADREIAALVAADPEAAEVTVVTSDRRLAREVERLGAGVMGAGGFRRELGLAGEER